MNYKKSPTETEILAYVKEGQIQFPPLQIVVDETEESATAENAKQRLDALLTLRWGERTFRFGLETQRLWTPKAVVEAIDQARRNIATTGVYPLIVVPYLGREQLLTLETEGVSGIDLCGNGVVVVPD